MATNDFLAFAGAGGANVLTQAQWAALGQLTTGFTSGILPGPNLNKALRQSSIMSSMIGAFIAQQSGQNAVDDGTTATLLTNFIAAIQALPTGRLLNVQVFATAGTFTYTPTAGTNFVILEVQGAGGAGGGAVLNAAGYCSAGVPGASGAYGKSRFTSAFSGVIVTVGAKGTGAAGVTGGNGGSSSFGALLSAAGGPGGGPGVSQNGSASGGNGAYSVATGANISSRPGQGDGLSLTIANTQVGQGAPGGASLFGSGGLGVPINTNGAAAVSRGSGGGGTAGSGNTSALTGGNGADGIVIVWEYS